MPNNEELETFQKQLDIESQAEQKLFEKNLLVQKGDFLPLGLQGAGTYLIAKTPNLDELDGTIDMDDID